MRELGLLLPLVDATLRPGLLTAAVVGDAKLVFTRPDNALAQAVASTCICG